MLHCRCHQVGPDIREEPSWPGQLCHKAMVCYCTDLPLYSAHPYSDILSLAAHSCQAATTVPCPSKVLCPITSHSRLAAAFIFHCYPGTLPLAAYPGQAAAM